MKLSARARPGGLHQKAGIQQPKHKVARDARAEKAAANQAAVDEAVEEAAEAATAEAAESEKPTRPNTAAEEELRRQMIVAIFKDLGSPPEDMWDGAEGMDLVCVSPVSTV